VLSRSEQEYREQRTEQREERADRHENRRDFGRSLLFQKKLGGEVAIDGLEIGGGAGLKVVAMGRRRYLLQRVVVEPYAHRPAFESERRPFDGSNAHGVDTHTVLRRELRGFPRIRAPHLSA